MLAASILGINRVLSSLSRPSSSPGTDLPNFPVRTHVGASTPTSSGLQQWTTVSDAIDHIPPGVSENTRPVTTVPPARWAAYDANLPHPSVVKTRLTSKFMCLPSGDEALSIRELACLQSFPHEHQFNGSRTQMCKQIGNAVPPLVGQAILKEVRESLTSTDLIHRDGRSKLCKSCFSLSEICRPDC